MATYLQLVTEANNNTDLRDRVGVALTIAAVGLLDSPTAPTAAQASWAKSVLSSPITEADNALRAVLAINNTATLAQIQGVSDATIQANIDAIRDSLIIAHSGSLPI